MQTKIYHCNASSSRLTLYHSRLANTIVDIQTQLYKYEIELQKAQEALDEEKAYNPDLSDRFYKTSPHNFTSEESYKENMRINELISNRNALALTIKCLRTWVMSQTRLEAETEVSQSLGSDNTDTYQNFTDSAGMAPDFQSYGYSDSIPTGQINTLDMSDFLSRPLKISQTEVKEGSDLTFSADIWEVFTSHPSIRAKLKNYAYFKGDLNVRITVSGTPWHFGKLQVSYQPLASMNANLAVLVPFLPTAKRILALTYLSQAKGAVTIDVHDNMPLEIKCPFIAPQPMLRLFNKSALILPDTTPFDDFVGFGKLYINSISPIQAVGTTATPVGIQIYAWVTDLELGVPTGTVAQIGTESTTSVRKVKASSIDERKTGPIEAIASNAANIAARASSFPIIGSFARAAERPLKLMAGLSSLFGFSYPTMINMPQRVKNEPFQNSSQFIGHDTGQRLTIDPKQELSVDPLATGTDVDELSYSYLCSRESLIDTFTWSSSNGQMASSIWMAPVNPNISKRVLNSGTTYNITPTPMSFVACAHTWWRGDITFRFEIVCSQFHRGTLAVLFEPNISQNVVIDTTLDLNKQFIKKVDLQTCTDFEVTVKWAYPRPWARVLTNDLLGDLGQVGFLGTSLFDYANGYIAVIPYTKLQSPDDSDITINVYIRSDDMNFNQYTLLNIPTSRPAVQSSTEVSTPHPVDSSDLNQSSASDENICTLTFGEMPISFRSALKRFAAWKQNDYAKLTTTSTAPFVDFLTPSWSEPTPSYVATGNASPNLFGYLRYAYLGFRGGTKHRVTLVGPCASQRNYSTIASLIGPGTGTPTTTIGYSTASLLASARSSGSVMFMSDTNAGIEFEVPLYTPNLFLVSFNNSLKPSGSIMDALITWGFTVSFTTVQNQVIDATYPLYVATTSAAAEDFSLMRFSGCPVYSYTA